MTRHLYKRTIKHDKAGKPVKVWYYWYDDGFGNQIRKSCGKRGKPCFLKRDAEVYLASLESEDEEKRSSAERLKSVTIADLAKDMFLPNSKHMQLKSAHGTELANVTIRGKRRNLENYILPYFGSYLPSEIDATEVEDWLAGFDRSNSWRNGLISCLDEVLDEALRYKIIQNKPVLKTFKRRVSKKDILTDQEIRTLFPDTYDELKTIWKTGRDTDDEGFMFGVFFSLMLSTGMRSGEIRALAEQQLSENMIIINRSYNSDGEVVEHLKMGNTDDPRFRVTVIPQRTLKLLKQWIGMKPNVIDLPELVFTYNGHPMTNRFVESKFEKALINIGVDTASRVLCPHCLRYSYNTIMGLKVPPEILRLMIGHNSGAMTEHYTRTDIQRHVKVLSSFSDQIDSFWGKS